MTTVIYLQLLCYVRNDNQNSNLKNVKRNIFKYMYPKAKVIWVLFTKISQIFNKVHHKLIIITE